MRAKEYQIVEVAVQNGLERGYVLAHKHVKNPTAEAIQDNQFREIMTEMSERFEFDEFDRLEG